MRVETLVALFVNAAGITLLGGAALLAFAILFP